MTSDDPQTCDSHEETEATDIDETMESAAMEEAQPDRKPSPGTGLQSIRNWWLVIAGMTFLLILSMVLGKRVAPSEAAPGGEDLAAMRAQVEALQADLNHQLAEMNMPPLRGHGEDASEITHRIRKDTETLISMMEQTRSASAEKDRMLTEKTQALIRSEQVRESLTAELARAQSNSASTAQAEQELTAALTRANRLADELAIAREMIAELSVPQDTAELESLRQRLEEATRARDFFEQRAMELEKSLSTPDGAPVEEE